MRGVDDDHVDARRRPAPRRARARRGRRRPRRRRAGGPARPSSRAGTAMRFWMSLTVIRPLSSPSPSTTGSFSMRCSCSSSLGLLERRADRRGDRVLRGHHVARSGWSTSSLEAQVAVGEDADQAAGVVGDRDARDVVVRHQRRARRATGRRAAASPARRSCRTRSASPCRPRAPARRSTGCGG